MRKGASHNSPHEGSIVRRKDGRYQAQIMINGKRMYKYSKKKSEVSDWLLQIRLKSKSLENFNLSLMKFSSWLEYYVDNFCGEVRYSTLENYRGYITNHVLKSNISNVILSDINIFQLNSFFASLTKKDGSELSSKTKRNILVFIRSSLQKAVEIGVLTKNPASFVHIKCGEKSERYILSDKEVRQLISAAGSSSFAPGIWIQASIGLRTSEVLALRRSSLIEKDGKVFVDIKHAVKRLPSEEGKITWQLAEPKTKTSIAIVPLPDFLADKLKKHFCEQDQNTTPLWCDDPFICCDPDTGGMVTPDRYRDFWAKLRKETGLPDNAVPHCLRHYTASSLINKGVSPATTARILRHAQSSTTMDYYVHATDSMTAEAVENLDNLFLKG